MRYFKIIGIMTLLVFSFYLTDFVTDTLINTNPIMQTIKRSEESLKTESVNAIIENNTIIPGIKGKKVNEMESFLNMKDFGDFNTNYIVYDSYNPDITIEDNKDKIIISGNKTIRQISLLINDNKYINKYLNNNKIKYSKLIKYNDKIDSSENINIESDEKEFNNLDLLLKKKELNKKICIINYSNIKSCKEKKYYLVKPNKIINNSNIVSNINNINNGDIILIDNKLNIENFKLIVNKMKSKDIKIVYLSEIIKE